MLIYALKNIHVYALRMIKLYLNVKIIKKKKKDNNVINGISLI